MSLRDTALCERYDDCEDLVDLTVPHPQPVSCEPIGFTPLEEQVIALAVRDTLASLEAPGRIERLVALVFGLKAQAHALADKRLEALRRAVVVTRHRHHMPDAVAVELRGSGFGARQLRAIEARATRG